MAERVSHVQYGMVLTLIGIVLFAKRNRDSNKGETPKQSKTLI